MFFFPGNAGELAREGQAGLGEMHLLPLLVGMDYKNISQQLLDLGNGVFLFFIFFPVNIINMITNICSGFTFTALWLPSYSCRGHRNPSSSSLPPRCVQNVFLSWRIDLVSLLLRLLVHSLARGGCSVQRRRMWMSGC